MIETFFTSERIKTKIKIFCFAVARMRKSHLVKITEVQVQLATLAIPLQKEMMTLSHQGSGTSA